MPQYRCITCGCVFQGGEAVMFGSFTEPAPPPCPNGPFIGVPNDQWHKVALATPVGPTPDPTPTAPPTPTTPAPMTWANVASTAAKGGDGSAPPLVKVDPAEQDAQGLIARIWSQLNGPLSDSIKAEKHEYEYSVSRTWADATVRAAIDIWRAQGTTDGFYGFHIPGYADCTGPWTGSTKTSGADVRKGMVQTNFVCKKLLSGREWKFNLHVTHRSSFT